MRAPRLLAALVAASVGGGTPVASQRSAPPPIRFELPNGLRVWVQEDHSRPVALVQVQYKVGAINEAPGTTGTAHYVEHMVYRATAHIRNEDIYGYIDRIGGRYTGGTSRDGTSYGETVPSWALEDAIRTTAERMGRTLFDSTEFLRERNNVVTEANGFARLDPLNAFRDAVMLTSFELHPYRYSSSTWAQDNLAITRDDAFDFYKRYYGPNNAVLAVVGDVRPADVRRLVERHFAPLARAPGSGEVRIVEPPQRAEKRVVMHSAGNRKQLEIVYRAPAAAHRDYPPLLVVDRVLSARLRRALAENGGGDLTTSQTATPYPFVYRIAVAADSAADLEKVVALIQGEIDRLRTEDVPAAELAAARIEPPQGRGGRGRGGAAQAGQASQSGGVPSRQSSLTQIADSLVSREVFPWEFGPDVRDRIARAQQTVTAANIAAYADRWLRTSQRTVGSLLPGPDDFMPQWSNGRALAGTRLEIPAMAVPPAKRMRPSPVPAVALRPLAALPLRTGRRLLANGVVVRLARRDVANASVRVRVATGISSDSLTAGAAVLAARLVARDSALAARMVTVNTATIGNQDYFDIGVDVPAADVTAAMEAMARALRVRAFDAATVNAARVPVNAGGGRGRGGGVSEVALDAQRRVLGAVAPSWRPGDPDVNRPTVADVNEFVARHFHGGALTVSVVGPDAPDALLENSSRAFSGIVPGKRAAPAASAPAAAPQAGEARVPLAAETQITVLAGLPGTARNTSDRRALELLNYIAGVPSYGGRLGWALTKTGLTYSAAAATTFGATTGHILFSTKCDTRNLAATTQAIREVLAGIAERGVDEWEVREAKAFTLGRMLLYGPRDDSGPDVIATALLDSEHSGVELLDLPAWSRAYLAVTREEINAAARRYYRPDQLTIVAIGAVPAGAPESPFAPGTFRALFEK